MRDGLTGFAREVRRNRIALHSAFRSLLENNLANKDWLDRLLPARRKAQAQAQAQVLVSTKRQVYGTTNPVPDDLLLKESRSRCHRLLTTDGAAGTSVEPSLQGTPARRRPRRLTPFPPPAAPSAPA